MTDATRSPHDTERATIERALPELLRPRLRRLERRARSEGYREGYAEGRCPRGAALMLAGAAGLIGFLAGLLY